ncbi:MAG: hypothetical protein JSS81_11525 [Acidobacteria bacterium]|nr:hypothetical protein [Acidobacteriota bacterium]
MARIEIITEDLDGKDYKRPGFNVSETVGGGGRNLIGDVMLVQAAMQFIGLGAPEFVRFVRKRKPTGKFDAETGREIWEFQRTWRFKLLAMDGLVHPASFENRRLKLGGPKMMIKLLNTFALLSSSSIREGTDYLPALQRRFPELRPFLAEK